MCSNGLYTAMTKRGCSFFPTRFHIASCSISDETVPAVRCGKYDQHIRRTCWISDIAQLVLPVVLKCCRHTWLTELPLSPWRQLRHWQRLSAFSLLHCPFHCVTICPYYKELKCLVLFFFLLPSALLSFMFVWTLSFLTGDVNIYVGRVKERKWERRVQTIKRSGEFSKAWPGMERKGSWD